MSGASIYSATAQRHGSGGRTSTRMQGPGLRHSYLLKHWLSPAMWNARSLVPTLMFASWSTRKPACGWSSSHSTSRPAGSAPSWAPSPGRPAQRPRRARRRCCSVRARRRMECVGTMRSIDSSTNKQSMSSMASSSNWDSSQKKHRFTKLHTKSSVITKYFNIISTALRWLSGRTSWISWPSTSTLSSMKHTGSTKVHLSTCPGWYRSIHDTRNVPKEWPTKCALAKPQTRSMFAMLAAISLADGTSSENRMDTAALSTRKMG
mmetsp:Transcript_82460/g.215214  ORF Transcript_82460/g.215214 Transcript_82460/m.215214 type:complete len:263 (-) Transcript_82460:1328-2116(-)